ncbi:MAG TPA: methyltransferase domain-containing protein [Nitrospira sp.]|nr:methyltransferase domain-containing protein [Nitrospira sp.]
MSNASVPVWNPSQYLGFADYRLRPAIDLISQMSVERPGTIYDLGCGAGNVTKVLQERWPLARIFGVDNSAEMLKVARAKVVGVEFLDKDLFNWAPPEPADILFSNAALHWLGDHETLFPRLVSWLKPGGTLAIQMPRNHMAPSHTLISDSAGAGPWREKLTPIPGPRNVGAPEDYYSLLAPLLGGLRIWETEYLQVLTGENPVVEWTKGTTLVPILSLLDEPDRSAFLADYSARIRRAYPPCADGKTLFPFRRLFIVGSH